MSDTRPIGFFDSGVGGISVLREAVSILPEEHFIFFGDSANAPYGVRTLENVRDLTIQHVVSLIEEGCKAIVIACNTATSAAALQLREKYTDIPIIGIEPALKPAALSMDHPHVVVMATPMTLRKKKFRILAERFEDASVIYPLPCPELVRYVEYGKGNSREAEAYLRDRFASLGDVTIDCVVLGCTHFPFAAQAIRRAAGQNVLLFDGGEGTARQLKRRLGELDLLAPSDQTGSVEIRNSSGRDDLIRLCEQLLAYSPSEPNA